jgi:hypothetical protein
MTITGNQFHVPGPSGHKLWEQPYVFVVPILSFVHAYFLSLYSYDE